MSRIGRKPIPLPKGVTVTVNGGDVTVKGPKGSLDFKVLPGISVEVKEDQVMVSRSSDEKAMRAAHGMTRAIINNMVVGVSQGFEKQLEIIGVGYRAQMQGKNLVLSLGFSHPVEVVPPAGIELAIDGPTKIFVRGIDRQKVGQMAAQIRGYRPPEPYKGKGIRYVGEYVMRKAGKAGSK
ncbi:ribosomal protein L6 [Thermanaerovibrio acidaminovorans DSM 6589]|uniref:Large ribosomal subunit protein uL6 n=1 Tax=Thermanaerovibrio acidaminovorans (strain ATCC 49978 / DSM 6589 / Su883) TaxID=525903 RepID=D1B5W0_THEAS|nr:50S ribosomal protein L6 [Thermanaerovibrio acidaminovorans]ACZ19401.1 ribosomal protein L6 [Thermanaerovibrio acidaminovorans DSM 6589]